jgi:hypothetical protein
MYFINRAKQLSKEGLFCIFPTGTGQVFHYFKQLQERELVRSLSCYFIFQLF